MTVADLYIVHQRGTYYNGIYMFVVEVGNFLVLVPSGYITLNLSWRMVYIIVVIIAGVQFVMTLLFFEKTNYRVSGYSSCRTVRAGRGSIVRRIQQTESISWNRRCCPF
ncbi:YALI0E00616p [Yarrowia lipolytica CLIB122]|uniref:YALI0E00616p n=2 Tax=Yarrowia lipolytica TaxID=4952 RepID=Q6C7I3_YARLI|nr:YALI0E00616p [Yarrowia lipolytica CLIB122]AOW04768.1 hypothetical protein YALI1_E00986g [Yarrowia lipolytica]CAG78958.1 YALI0E00616p [Yarrowia lipolytica CLIB122]|eukprot:XP_503379.1 YALI0E00616p [Yarrowia lipolytica CLIB122]